MGTVLVGAIYTLLQNLVNGVVWVLAVVLVNISQYALTAAQQPWVHQATQVSVAVASGLFSVRVAWEALTRYILWNEGTADADGGQIWKGILRVACYGAAGTWLVYTVFQFGIWYGAALLAAPLSDAVTNAQNVIPHLMAIPGMAIESLMILTVGFLMLIVCLAIVSFQMTIRATELIFFVVSAPIVALGQFSPEGGIWNSWWRSLVVLSLSLSVQWLGIKAVVGSMQVITTTGSSITNLAINVTSPGALAAFGLFLSLGAAIATLRGPHLLKEWSYRTGIGSGVIFAGQTVGRAWVMSRLGR